MAILVPIFFGLLVTVISYWLFKTEKGRNKMKWLPEVPKIPILGNVLKPSNPTSVTDSTAPVAPPGENKNNWMPNIISRFNGIASNFVQGIPKLGGNGGTPQGQVDEGTEQPACSGFQRFFQFFNKGNAISNLFQGNQNRPPTTSEDEGTVPARPGITNIIQNIKSAIHNSPLNPFRPQGGISNQNAVQNAIPSVDQQAQQIIPSAEQSQTPQGIKNPVVIEEKSMEQPEKPLIEN